MAKLLAEECSNLILPKVGKLHFELIRFVEIILPPPQKKKERKGSSRRFLRSNKFNF